MADEAETKTTETTETKTAEAATEPKAVETKAAETAAAETKATEAKVEDKPADADKPIVYADFKAPEGMTLDAEQIKAVVPMFQEMKLSQEQAQKLVDYYAAQVKAAGEAGAKAWANTIGGWQGDFKKSLADSKEFTGAEHGGDRLKEVQVLTAKAVTAYGGEDAAALLQHMKTYALGDYGPMARFMARVGRSVREDTRVVGTEAPRTLTPQQLYPNTTMNP